MSDYQGMDGRSPEDYAEGRRVEAERFLALTNAYRNTFSGNATQEEARAVLDDLAKASGFYRVLGQAANGEQRAFADGARSVFAAVFNALRMTDQEIRDLETRSRAQALGLDT